MSLTLAFGYYLCDEASLAMSRADIPEDQRVDFSLYVEFQNFATDSFESILSEARKYKLESYYG